ncbi:MAG TPA: FeoA domain-containing protein [Pirellulales bacterium]
MNAGLLLTDLKIGQAAVITDVRGEDDLAMRLMEMGLLPGVRIVYHGAAPLGDPLEVEVGPARLGLRRSEAARLALQRES